MARPRGHVSLILAILAGIIAPAPTVAQTGKAVIGIYSSSPTGTQVGTGFIASSDGHIVTAYHVIQNGREVTLVDSEKKPVNSVGLTVLYTNGASDIAVLRVPSLTGKKAVSFRKDSPATTESLTVVGYPNAMTNAVVAAKAISDEPILPVDSPFRTGSGPILQGDLKIIPLDMTIYSGMSGAPLIDSSGKVLGIVSGSLNVGGSFAWAIPSVQVVSALEESKHAKGSALKDTKWEKLSLISPFARGSVRSYSQAFSIEEWLAGLEATTSEFVEANKALALDGPVIGRVFADPCKWAANELRDLEELDLPAKLSTSTWILARDSAQQDYKDYRRQLSRRIDSSRRLLTYIDTAQQAFASIFAEMDDPVAKIKNFEMGIALLTKKLSDLIDSASLEARSFDEWIQITSEIVDREKLNREISRKISVQCADTLAQMRAHGDAQLRAEIDGAEEEILDLRGALNDFHRQGVKLVLR